MLRGWRAQAVYQDKKYKQLIIGQNKPKLSRAILGPLSRKKQQQQQQKQQHKHTFLVVPYLLDSISNCGIEGIIVKSYFGP